MSEVVVLGTCVTDLISFTPRFPVPGETIVANGFHKDFGGKGANTAFMAANLGIRTELLAKIGDDPFGEEHSKYLNSINIGTKHLTTAKGFPTAVSTITVADNGENTIVYSPGAADHMNLTDIDKAEDCFREAKVLASVFETDVKNVLRAAQLAKRYGAITYFNAAPINPHQSVPKECLQLIDYLCINEVEGAALAKQLKADNQLIGQPLTDQQMTDFLIGQGVHTVILTKGSKGAAFASRDEPELKLIPVKPVENVVDTTGAGDAFNGGFIYQLICNPTLSTSEKIRKACGIASLSVQKKGTQSSYPKKSEVPEDYL